MRTIVVGTGFGSRVHVPALGHAGFEVAALVGRDLEKTARRAARAGVPHAFSSVTEALALPGIAAVVIASPPDTHAPLALEALAAGLHVLVEKPFTLNVAQARELRDAAETAGRVGLVGHEFRFAPERAAVTRALARGAVGTPRLATFIWHLPVLAALDAPVPAWWFDAARGGGWLNASVSHFADAVRLWFGAIATVNASLPMVSSRDPARMAEDSVVLRFRTAAGCEGVIEQSAAVWGDGFQVMRIAGTDGNLVVDGGRVTLITKNGSVQLDVAEPAVDAAPSSDPRHQFTHLELGPAVRQAQAFRRLIEGGSISDEPLAPATFADGAAAMSFLDAARRSAAADGAPVAVG
jgi:predicted dehydrogenase